MCDSVRKTATLEQLTKRIEQLMREHVAGVQLAAMKTVARAVAQENRSRRVQPSTPRSSNRKLPRNESEIAALGERLYEVVCKKAGELMGVFAAELNSSANELQLSMRRLRNNDRVRSVGTRYQTRYFPL